MQVLNQIGHIQYWGMSPAINFLKDIQQQTQLKVLISGCSDIRHILKSICDICTQKKFKKIEIYFHQTQKQLICRALLFLHILHQKNLNYDERVQLFLDLYGNAKIKEKTAKYLDVVSYDLLNLIHQQKKTLTILKTFVDLKHIKFQQRDQLSEIIQSWNLKVPFDIQKLRDQRLRYHYKQRYDFRTNLIDWDYNMLLQQYAPIIHYYHYRQWRQSGLAFQNRFSTYVHPNRTLSSYIPGRKSQTKQSCLVRGYWGDIICSPYITFGIECEYPQKNKLFQKANEKYLGHAVEMSQYNLRYYLQKIDSLNEYKKKFEDYYRSQQRQKQLKKEKQQQQKKLKSIKEQDQQQIEQKKIKNKNLTQDQRDKIQKQITQVKDAKQIEYLKIQQPMLKAFEQTGLKFFPLCMNLENLKKKKFQDFFDIGVIGFGHSAYFKNDLKIIFKSGAKVYVENARFLISHKKQERLDINKKLEEIITSNGMIILDSNLVHHTTYAKP